MRSEREVKLTGTSKRFPVAGHLLLVAFLLALLAFGVYIREQGTVFVAAIGIIVMTLQTAVFASVLVRRVMVDGDRISIETYTRRTSSGAHFLLTDAVDRYADLVDHLRERIPKSPIPCPPAPWWQRIARARE